MWQEPPHEVAVVGEPINYMAAIIANVPAAIAVAYFAYATHDVMFRVH